MPLYRYEAEDGTGSVVVGAMDAPDEHAVAARLGQLGYRSKTVASMNVGAPAPAATPATKPTTRLSEAQVAAAGSRPADYTPAQPTMMTGVMTAPAQSTMMTGVMTAPAHQTSMGSFATSQIKPITPHINRTGPSAAHPTTKRSATVKTSNEHGVKAKDLALFFRQFAAFNKAGISVFDALDKLAPRTRNVLLSKITSQMSSRAKSGGEISQVMEEYPRVFPSHVVAGIRAGELGGFIDIVLDEIALEYEQEVAFYKNIWLPKSLIIQQMVAVALAQPLFPNVFPNADYSLYLKLLLFRNVPIVIGVIILAKIFWYWIQLPEQRDLKDHWTLKAPIFGDLNRQRCLAAFVRMLRRLYHSGVGPLQAWEGAVSVAPNKEIRDKLELSSALMSQNMPLHEAFAATGLFADEMESVLATGVYTGQTVDMLDRVAEYYQENVDRAFSKAKFWMYRLAITMFIALIGLTVCWMAYSYFKGIFAFADSFAPPD
ncbi:MAG: type II secretion system F family protein [Chthonomonadales bacterium]